MTDQTVTSTIWIPLLRVLLTGGLFVLVIVTWFNMQNRVSSWSIGFFFGSLLSFVYWAFSSFNKTTVIETVEVEPMEQPQIYPQNLKAEIVARDPQSVYMAGRWLDLPIDPERGKQVAIIYCRTNNFSMDAISGVGKPLSRSEYTLLRDAFIDRGLAYWVNDNAHSQGVALTRGGEALMKRLANTGGSRAYVGTNEV